MKKKKINEFLNKKFLILKKTIGKKMKKSNFHNMVPASKGSSSESDNESLQSNKSDIDYIPEEILENSKKRKRGRKLVLHENTTAILDRTNISDRKAALVVNNVVISLGQNIFKMSTSRSSIQRARKNNREKISSEIKENFNINGPICVHWDGKMLPDMTNKYKKKN